MAVWHVAFARAVLSDEHEQRVVGGAAGGDGIEGGERWVLLRALVSDSIDGEDIAISSTVV